MEALSLLILFIIVLSFVAVLLAHKNFNKKDIPRSEEEHKPVLSNRRTPADVMPRDMVRVYLSNSFPDHTEMAMCINNDPETKKMCLTWKWVDSRYTQVFNYSSKTFDNFHLLNPDIKIKKNEFMTIIPGEYMVKKREKKRLILIQ